MIFYKKLSMIATSLFIFVLQVYSQQPNQTITLEKLQTLSCGKQPKQVLFSPDGKYIVLPLLDDNGFQIIEISPDAAKAPQLISPPNASKKGFAEGLFVPEENAFFVSQMTTGNIYQYEYPGFKYKRTIYTEGTWSKFIAWSKEKNLIAVSNWVSNDVSLIDYESGKVLRKIKTAAAPRGLSFLNNGNEILVLCFDGGKIQKFSTSNAEKLSECKIKSSAMRHVVVNKNETTAYISDMYHHCIYELNLLTFKITGTWKVFSNPNTIALLDDRFLFVSSRGPNNKTDYTKRSPVNGKVSVIDVTSGKIICQIEGGNQPTGLSLSPNDTMLCFSNFQDENVELYKINCLQP